LLVDPSRSAFVFSPESRPSFYCYWRPIFSAKNSSFFSCTLSSPQKKICPCNLLLLAMCLICRAGAFILHPGEGLLKAVSSEFPPPVAFRFAPLIRYFDPLHPLHHHIFECKRLEAIIGPTLCFSLSISFLNQHYFCGETIPQPPW